DERNARLQSLLISAASTDSKCLEQVLMISVSTLIASCSLSSSSGGFGLSLQFGLRHVIDVLHTPLPGACQHLTLPIDELGLDTREFLGLFHTNELVSEVECIFKRLFSKQYGVADKSRLLVNATSGVPGYRQ